jgi:cytochrome c2
VKISGIVWNAANLTRSSARRDSLVRRTKIGFVGLGNDQDIADVLACLTALFVAKGNSTARK